MEKVVDVRIKNGKREDLLKWKNYPDSENTWEPHSNLDYPELISDFEDRLKKKNEEKKRNDRLRKMAAPRRKRRLPTRKITNHEDSAEDYCQRESSVPRTAAENSCSS